MEFTNAAGASRFGRYRIVPEAGNAYLDDAAAKAKDANYLFTELPERVAKAPVRFKILVQLANPGDVVDDVTIPWPADREQLELGTLTLTAPVADNAAAQKQIIFDPIPRLAGIAPSADPLLELRAAIYLLSGRRRRSA
jgi:catalase